jgi:hypothetical protein
MEPRGWPKPPLGVSASNGERWNLLEWLVAGTKCLDASFSLSRIVVQNLYGPERKREFTADAKAVLLLKKNNAIIRAK